MNESVGELMQKISRMSNVFRVQLLKSGHSEQFKAIAHIQGSDHSYTVEMDNPIYALRKLKCLITNIIVVCPHCDHVITPEDLAG